MTADIAFSVILIDLNEKAASEGSAAEINAQEHGMTKPRRKYHG